MTKEEMVTALNIPVILGSVRSGRASEKVAWLLRDRVEKAGHYSTLIDLKELALPVYGEELSSHARHAVASLGEHLTRSDASIWLTPEYNHGYTSAIKNAVDYLGDQLKRKPAVVCGLSSGIGGGIRAVEQFKQVLIEFHALPIRTSVYFGEAGQLFDEDGAVRHPSVVERVDAAVADLSWYATVLAWGRENVTLPDRHRN
jgi:NAD(P)H-dependent FMN reductase